MCVDPRADRLRRVAAAACRFPGDVIGQHDWQPGRQQQVQATRHGDKRKQRTGIRQDDFKPRLLWNRWFTLLAGNSAVPIWGSWLEQGFFGSVLRVDHQRWDQTVADLRHLALSAAHPRSRERFLALHEIADGGCATAVAERTGRRAQTVMGWLHVYNDHGPEALTYQRSGGRPPLCPEIAAALGEQVRAAECQAATP